MSGAEAMMLSDDMPTTVIFGPAPAGIDLSADYRTIMIVPTVLLLVVAAMAVCMRVAARWSQNVALAADDYLIIVAWFLALLCGISTILTSVLGGVGRHIWDLTIGELKRGYIVDFPYELVYLLTLPTIKLSILFFYHRLFPVFRRFTIALYVVGAIVIAWCVSGIIATFLQCRPISYLWEMYTAPGSGHCFDIYHFHYGIALSNIITDVIILVLPIPIVWNLQMPRPQRIALCGIFFLGSFVCVASAVRLHDLTYLHHGYDVTWWNARPLIWSCVEPCVGILSACLPTMRPLLRSLFPSWFALRGASRDSRRRSSGQSASSAGSDNSLRKEKSLFGSFSGAVPIVPPEDVFLRPDRAPKGAGEFTVSVATRSMDEEQGWGRELPLSSIRVEQELLVEEGRASREALGNV